MVDVKLIYERMQKAVVDVEITETRELKLRNSFSMKAQFVNDNSHVRVYLSLGVVDAEKNEVCIQSTTEGIFEVSGIKSDTDIKVVHTKCFSRLFVEAEKHMKTLAEQAGMEGMPIAKPKFDYDDIEMERYEQVIPVPVPKKED